MLESVGLRELVAENAQDYEQKAIRLIKDDTWRADLSKRIAKVDLTTAEFALTHPAIAFCNAIVGLIN